MLRLQPEPVVEAVAPIQPRELNRPRVIVKGGVYLYLIINGLYFYLASYARNQGFLMPMGGIEFVRALLDSGYLSLPLVLAGSYLLRKRLLRPERIVRLLRKDRRRGCGGLADAYVSAASIAEIPMVVGMLVTLGGEDIRHLMYFGMAAGIGLLAAWPWKPGWDAAVKAVNQHPDVLAWRDPAANPGGAAETPDGAAMGSGSPAPAADENQPASGGGAAAEDPEAGEGAAPGSPGPGGESGSSSISGSDR
ncbi:MAG: hypothetical protein GMKNLPBB_00300 [Myxococcota bacterium]|nr:hypothetical protein [Myxococcota bacterium]